MGDREKVAVPDQKRVFLKTINTLNQQGQRNRSARSVPILTSRKEKHLAKGQASVRNAMEVKAVAVKENHLPVQQNPVKEVLPEVATEEDLHLEKEAEGEMSASHLMRINPVPKGEKDQPLREGFLTEHHDREKEAVLVRGIQKG